VKTVPLGMNWQPTPSECGLGPRAAKITIHSLALTRGLAGNLVGIDSSLGKLGSGMRVEYLTRREMSYFVGVVQFNSFQYGVPRF
jgi:hypothetical protein